MHQNEIFVEMEDQIFIGLKSFKQTLVEALYLVVALK